MANSVSKLNQALKDLVESYLAIDEEYQTKFEDDEDAYASAMIEVLENGIEGAIDEVDASSAAVASMISALSEALEQLDPSAFDEDAEEFDADDAEYEGDEDDLEIEDEDEDE